MPDTPDEARSAPRQPRQSQEVDPGLRGDAPLMSRLAVVVEGVYLKPVVVDGEAGRPDDGRNPGSGEIEFEDGIGHAFRIGGEDPGVRLLGQIETVARD